jgi:hypothetical protein
MSCGSKSQKGGSGAADWGAKVWGTGDAQTAIHGTNQILAKDPLSGSSGSSSLSVQPYSKGGSSKKNRKNNNKKKGGMAVSEVLVPGILLYAANAYGKRGTKKTQGGKRKSRKARRSSKNRK